MDNLTEHEKHMCEMLVRKMRGEVVERRIDGEWCEGARDFFAIGAEYRKPVKKIIIPWDLIDDKWVAFAVNGNGLKYFHSNKDSGVVENEWDGTGAAEICQLKIDTDGIDWKDTLTLRPETT